MPLGGTCGPEVPRGCTLAPPSEYDRAIRGGGKLLWDHRTVHLASGKFACGQREMLRRVVEWMNASTRRPSRVTQVVPAAHRVVRFRAAHPARMRRVPSAQHNKQTSLNIHRRDVASGGFQLERLVGHWPRGRPLLCWFRLPQAYFRNPWASPGGSNVRNATKCVLINMIPILIAAVQKQFLFID